ncbi:MAG: ATP-binding cassette domain-containing protein [Lachnospiraceae bacterium]|nr:ATP-binding cassette domain-containing protein [Lachnospiraceae bacterium]
MIREETARPDFLEAPEPEKNILLKADDIRVTFRGKDRKTTVKAVDGVSLSIHKGEILGIVGESGCGKSTLGRAILNLIPLTSGKVYFEGQDLSTLSKKEMKDMRKKMQIIFQDPSASLNPRRTVEQILFEPYIIHGYKDKNYIRKDILRLLELVGLAEYHLSRYSYELSGGQKQRIGIARALALKPELIICDEAVSALDVSVQAQVLNLLMDLKKELGLTYLFISHNLNVIYQISDRVGVMYLGRLVELGPYKSLYEEPAHPYTEALLSAIPQIHEENRRERIHLQGEVPSPINPPSGCHFHTRCPHTCEVCSMDVPPWRKVGDRHFAACYWNPKSNEHIV